MTNRPVPQAIFQSCLRRIRLDSKLCGKQTIPPDYFATCDWPVGKQRTRSLAIGMPLVDFRCALFAALVQDNGDYRPLVIPFEAAFQFFK